VLDPRRKTFYRDRNSITIVSAMLTIGERQALEEGLRSCYRA